MALDIRRAETIADFEAAAGLRRLMQHWDETETAKLGLPVDELASVHYAGTASDQVAKFTRPRSAFLLAWSDGTAAGSIGYSPAGDEATAEIHKMFVLPEFRGRGIARTLMVRALDGIREAGYRAAVIETATFMHDAIKLYRSFGFLESEAFRPFVSDFHSIAVWMRLKL